MSIETTGQNAVCLYDSVTGIAFGPVFEDVPEADAFQRWYERPQPADGRVIEMRWLTRCLPDEQKATADAWATFRDTHREDECPYDVDRDSYGIGYTGDSDKSYGDWTAATPDACGCACHSDETRMVPDGQRARR